MNEILFRAMGSEIFCAVDTPSPLVAQRLARVPAMFEAWEKTLSRFRTDSELSQLNARAGETVRVSDTLWQVLKLAECAQAWTDFLVTPLVLNALQEAGYTRSFEQMQCDEKWREPNQPREFANVPTLDLAWRMHEKTHTVTLSRDARLDLGGVAKGWAAEKMARYLGELGAAMIDAGGDMVLTAPPSEGAWRVGIENPLVPEDDSLPVLELARGAVATSGRDFRRWMQNGRPAHHLIDPRTNLPAVTDVLTATIVAPTIFQAEVAAKVAVILGSADGMNWVNASSELSALLILEDGTIVMNEPMEQYIR